MKYIKNNLLKNIPERKIRILVIMSYYICKLPIGILFTIGKIIGLLAYIFLKEKRKLIKENIEKCFTHKSNNFHKKLTKKHFQNLGIAVFETLIAYTNKNKKLSVEVSGKEHIFNSLKKGNGIVLLYGHFTIIDIGIKLITDALKGLNVSVVYTPALNKNLDTLQANSRKQYLEIISKKEPKKMYQNLKDNKIMIFLPDLYLGEHKRNLEVPFLTYKKNIMTSCSNFAKICKSDIIPLQIIREKNFKYKLIFEKPLKDVVGEEIKKETITITQTLERHIKSWPEAYFWIVNQFR